MTKTGKYDAQSNRSTGLHAEDRQRVYYPVGHALYPPQTALSLFLWTVGVYDCVGALGSSLGTPPPSRPTSSLWAMRRIQPPVSLDTFPAD